MGFSSETEGSHRPLETVWSKSDTVSLAKVLGQFWGPLMDPEPL